MAHPATTQLVIFDLDHTLLQHNSSIAYGGFLYQQKVFSFFKMLKLLWLYRLHKYNLLTLAHTHHLMFRVLFSKRPADFFFAKVQEFLDLYLERLWNPVILQELKKAQAESHHVALLSSSPDFLVEQVAKRLGVTHWMGSVYAVDANNKFHAITHVIDGPDKAQKMRELADHFRLPPQAVTAFSDSCLDIPLFRAVGRAVAVNPDKKLLEECHKCKWEILWT